MRKISYERYLDKVFGCWTGKGVSGTIGAPFEGRKELFNYSFDKRSIEKMLPNDDLDLQVLWLEVMEEKGIYFKTEHLEDAFLNKCPYSPGEYAIFKKNYSRKLTKEVVGSFNNSFYFNGNGCPIRSEIWACIAPGDPALAAEYAKLDGIMDHANDSVEAEVFYAALEAEAFFEDDIEKLIEAGLLQITLNGMVYNIVRDVLEWYHSGFKWQYTRNLIISKYGHPDCTNNPQNTGFTVLSLLYSNGNFMESTMIGLNCGFDTDCTCSTAGAMLGIIYGAKRLKEEYGFDDPGYILTVNCTRRSDKLFHLAEDTCRVGLTVIGERSNKVRISALPIFTPVPKVKYILPIEVNVFYDEIPAIGVGETSKVYFTITNNTNCAVNAKLALSVPANWKYRLSVKKIKIEASESVKVMGIILVPSNIDSLYEDNILSLNVVIENKNSFSTTCQFGLVGAAVWKMYGPFWDNVCEMPEMNYWDSYYAYFKPAEGQDGNDLVRDYHVNTFCNVDKQYIDEASISLNMPTSDIEPAVNGYVVNTYTDRFNMDDFVGLQGASCVYLVRELISPIDQIVGIQLGQSDAFKLWVNDKLLSQSSDVAFCTNENKHILNVPLNKGSNKIVFKLARRGALGEYSLIFCEGGSCTTHILGLGSVNPNNGVK